MTEKFPQTPIDGENNIWIVKPAIASRGRGIKVFKNLVEILAYVRHANNWNSFVV